MAWRQIPGTIPLLALALMACGWVAIARSEEIADIPSGTAWRQAIWSAAAMAVMFSVAAPSYRLTIRIAYLGFGVTVVALVSVYLFGPINGAHRWIRLGPVGFQPSEFAKIAVVLALARYLMYRDSASSWLGVLAPLAITLVPIWLVLKEPDLGTSLVFLPVLFAMLYASGVGPRRLAAIAVVGLLAMPMLWGQMSRDQRSRVTALWEQSTPGQSPTPAGYHLHQAKRMFALGGYFGSVFADDATAAAESQADRRVPEPHTDSIFSVFGERFGIVGCGGVLLLYALLLWRGLTIAQKTGEPFGRLVVVGVMAMIGFQVIINTGMLVGLLPITGLPLPLMSYGGSGLLATAIGLGLVMNIAARPGYEMAAHRNRPSRARAA